MDNRNEDSWDEYFPKSYVHCPLCEAEHGTEEVVFVDISEGMLGEDRMKFNCPFDKNAEVLESTVFGRR